MRELAKVLPIVRHPPRSSHASQSLISEKERASDEYHPASILEWKANERARASHFLFGSLSRSLSSPPWPFPLPALFPVTARRTREREWNQNDRRVGKRASNPRTSRRRECFFHPTRSLPPPPLPSARVCVVGGLSNGRGESVGFYCALKGEGRATVEK